MRGSTRAGQSGTTSRSRRIMKTACPNEAKSRKYGHGRLVKAAIYTETIVSQALGEMRCGLCRKSIRKGDLFTWQDGEKRCLRCVPVDEVRKKPGLRDIR